MMVGIVLTWLARRAAVWVDLLDHPDQGRKKHREPIPLMGGVAVMASLLLAVGGLKLATVLHWIDVDITLAHGSLLASAILFCGVGLYDDRFNIRPRNKFLLQLLAALPFLIGGRVITECGLFGEVIHLGWWGPPVTLFWITLCVNSVNLLDGLDGVAGSVAVVVSGTVCVLSLSAGHLDTALIALALAGSVIGFLAFNWPPAKIFLGDSGSLTIGFLLGALAIEGSLKTATGLTLAAPLVLMSIPGFDTSMAVLRRLLNGNGIGQGDRAHLHHCLKDRGLSAVQIVLAISGMCGAMGIAVIAAAYYQSDWIAIGGCAAILVVLVVGRVFGYHETQLMWQHLRHLSISSARAPKIIRLRTLCHRFETSEWTSEQAWEQLRQFVELHDGERLIVSLGNHELFAWQRNEDVLTSDSRNWEFCYDAATACDRRVQVSLAAGMRTALAHQSAEHLCQLIEAFGGNLELGQIGTMSHSIEPRRHAA